MEERDVLDEVRASAQLTLAQQGVDAVEAIGEMFIRDRFVTACSVPDPIFAAARLEKFTRATFPRILLDPRMLENIELDSKRVLADFERLVAIVRERGDEFSRLASTLDDVQRFRQQARDLGLTETDFVQAGGGFLLVLVVLAAALVLTGCPSESESPFCPTKCPLAGNKHVATCSCNRELGHKLNHRCATTNSAF